MQGLRSVSIKRTSRISGGHLWVFSNELAESPAGLVPGSLVRVVDRHSQFYGIGYINPNSLISIRFLTRHQEEINKDFFIRRIEAAFQYRKRFLTDLSTYRLIYSEGDLLPGLIVDIYGSVMAVQFLTYGMDALAETVLSALQEVICPDCIVIRNDSPARQLEGLNLSKSVYKGSLSTLPVVNEEGVLTEVNPYDGQKTGAFLDQRFNRAAFASLIDEGSEGLDLFCYSGSWGLHAMKRASAVTFVDDSETAMKMTERNLRINGHSSGFAVVRDDVFNFLKVEVSRGKTYDFIILDPPAFAKSKNKTKEALRGYREINALAMTSLRSGGLLATSSCSHHIDRYMFLDTLERASKETGRTIRIIDSRSQAPDHPTLLSMPETEYLKTLFMEAL